MVGYMAELTLKGCPVYLIGGGRVAYRKLTGLLPCEPHITVIAPLLHPQVAALVQAGACRHRRVPFSPTVLDDHPRPLLVFAVTDRAPLNRGIAHACRDRGLLCNSADDVESSGFLVPAVVRQGAVTLAVATGGHSPALSRLIKERLQRHLEPGWGALAALFGGMRAHVKERLPEPEVRHAFWRETCLAVERERRFDTLDHTAWFEARLRRKIVSG